MKIFSDAFHTSYQYNLASAFPEHQWTFAGSWSKNRPECDNVILDHVEDLSCYDFFLAHSPTGYISLADRLDVLGINRSRLIYITHWGRQPSQWIHVYSDVDFDTFLRDVSKSPIVCVSHYMVPQFGFYSDVSVGVIPHFIPQELFDHNIWSDGGDHYINVVNSFYEPERGVGAPFWDALPVPKRLYGAGNKPTDGGSLQTIEEFKSAIHDARAYLWTADAVATSFAPLEAMALGCPIIAPDNLDWRLEFEHGREILLYRPGDQASCLEQIRQFEGDAGLRSALSRAGREAVFDRFRKDLFRERWERVFDAALAADRLRRPRGSCELRRGTGVMAVEADPSRFDLVTELRLADIAARVVHPQSGEFSIRQILRNKSNSIDLLKAFHALASSENISDGSFASFANDYGATTQSVNGSINIGCAISTKEYISYEIRSDEFSKIMYRDSSGCLLDFVEVESIGVNGIHLPIDPSVMSILQSINGPFFVNYDGLEPAVIMSLLELDVFPKEIIANCMPHVSWAKGCHVEILIDTLFKKGYSVEYLSIPDLSDLTPHIAPNDLIPKLHRYILRAVLA